MATTVDYNQRGSLLEELAAIDDLSEHRGRLFEVIDGIRDILVPEYADGLIGVKKLEQRLTLRSSFTKEALELFSRGVQVPLQRGLDDLEEYSRDTVNEVFIALYGQLVNEINGRQLYDIVNHDRYDDTNVELGELMNQIEIYHTYSTWVNQNERVIEGLNQQDGERASKQFRDLKKSVGGIMSAFKILIWQDNNIESAYAGFNVNKTLENYDSARDVVEGTISDCNKLISQNGSSVKGNGWAAIIKFASTIQFNAEYYILKMGYDVYHDNTMRGNLQYPEQFKQDLMDGAGKMRYFHTANLIDVPSTLQLSSDENAFYEVKLSPKSSY
ncbi:MAG: hypothetical protein IH934_07605 [Nanoarchaeota archaeon]|nr:hypothetical protein [Nanoarchaeota archaeon]